MEDLMQLAPPHSAVDGPFTHPEREQLPTRNRPMLPLRKLA